MVEILNATVVPLLVLTNAGLFVALCASLYSNHKRARWVKEHFNDRRR